MSLLAARLLARRITTRGSTATAAASQQKRRMGAAAPAPEWTGIDKVVRGYFPQDDQLAAAILGGYFGLFILYKIKSAFSSPAIEAAAPVVAASSASVGSIPDVGSEEFGAFLESEENVNKLIESWEK